MLGIPPSGVEPNTALRERIRETNRRVRQQLLDSPEANFLDLYPEFVDESDRWRPGLTLDGTHLSAAGYERLAEVIEPELRRLLAF